MSATKMNVSANLPPDIGKTTTSVVETIVHSYDKPQMLTDAQQIFLDNKSTTMQEDFVAQGLGGIFEKMSDSASRARDVAAKVINKNVAFMVITDEKGKFITIGRCLVWKQDLCLIASHYISRLKLSLSMGAKD